MTRDDVVSRELPRTLKINVVGGRIKYAREAMGWDKTRLAREMGVSKATVSDWESGKIKNLKMSHLVQLSEKTNFAITWIAIGKGNPAKRLVETDDEIQLITLFRAMRPETQRSFLGIATAAVSQESNRPNRFDPFRLKITQR